MRVREGGGYRRSAIKWKSVEEKKVGNVEERREAKGS